MEVSSQDMASWEFDVWKYSEDELVQLLYEMFEKLGYIKSFQLNPERLQRFLQDVRQNQFPNPYHNFHHITEVAQFIYKLSFDGVLDWHLKKTEQFSLFLAAICHDVGHRGRNNEFQRKFNTEVYQQFGDRATLEQYHVALGLSLLNKSRPLLENLSPKQITKIERLFTSLIMGTDLNSYKADLKRIKLDCLCDQGMIGRIVLRCADIGNKVRPQHINDRWAMLLAEEFFLQGDEERSHGFPVSFLMSRDHPSSAPKEQVYFVSNICMPYFKCLAEIFPELNELRERAEANLQTWKERAEE